MGEELSKYGKRGAADLWWWLHQKKNGLYDAVTAEMKKSGLEWEELSGIDPNPRISTVRQGAALCKEKQIDVLLAVGGGSTLDATKWMAVGACTERDLWDFLKDRGLFRWKRRSR